MSMNERKTMANKMRARCIKGKLIPMRFTKKNQTAVIGIPPKIKVIFVSCHYKRRE
jgi:hypothetical protein